MDAWLLSIMVTVSQLFTVIFRVSMSCRASSSVAEIRLATSASADAPPARTFTMKFALTAGLSILRATCVKPLQRINSPGPNLPPFGLPVLLFLVRTAQFKNFGSNFNEDTHSLG